MWIARDERDSLNMFTDKPIRCENPSVPWFDKEGNKRETKIFYDGTKKCRRYALNRDMYPHITFENSPKELVIKDDYHELVEYKTKEINSLSRKIIGYPIEETANIIRNIEDQIHTKYKMVNNPYCSQNIRSLTIGNNYHKISDNSLREYIVNDRIVATIYIRRNDFNSNDILVSDFGNLDEEKNENI